MKAWLIASVTAPLAVFAGGSSWPVVLAAVLACGAANLAVVRYCKKRCEVNRIISVIEWLWLCIYLGGIAAYSGNCWQEGSAYPVVPLVLVLLGCISAQSGGAQASKTGAVLLWLVVAVLGLVIGAGTKDIKLEWLKPGTGLKSEEILLLLTPCVMVFMPVDKPRGVLRALLWIGVVTVAASLWINGAMSQKIAAQVKDPLYEFSKSISLLGTVKRFEAVVSCGITAGRFCLFSLILSTAGHIAENVKADLGKKAVWGCGIAASAGMLLGQIRLGIIAAVVSAVLWVLIPVLICWSEKRCEKKEK